MINNYIVTVDNGITYIKFLESPSFGQIKVIIDDIAENYPYEKRLWDLSSVSFDLPVSEL